MNIKVAVVTVLIGFWAADAAAQPGWYRPFAEVPPYEVMRLVRARGLTPISRPVLVGPNYVVQATDRNGDVKRVVVDAEFGEVMRIVSVNRPPPPSAPPGWARQPRPPYGPDDDEPVGGLPPGPPPHAKPRTAAVTPLPRPRPASPENPVVAKPEPAEQPTSPRDVPADAKPNTSPPPVAAAAPRVVLPGGPNEKNEAAGEIRNAAPSTAAAPVPAARTAEPSSASELPPVQPLD